METVGGHRDIAQKHDGDEPAQARQPRGLLISDPNIKSEEARVGVKEGRDKPRMRINIPRHSKQWAMKTRPRGDAEHGGENHGKKKSKQPKHGRITKKGCWGACRPLGLPKYCAGRKRFHSNIGSNATCE